MPDSALQRSADGAAAPAADEPLDPALFAPGPARDARYDVKERWRACTNLPADHPLRKMDNVTLLPHLGYVSEDVYATFWGQSIENVEAWLDGKPLRVLNPESLS